MSEPNILLIREAIQSACAEEAESGALLRFLEALAPKLHQAIQFAEPQPARALFDFLIAYIEHVPNFIEALTALMKKAKVYEHGQALIAIAVDFFLQPPATQPQAGLYALIDKAYLAHRLMEEVNDRVLMTCGVPLTPMDMTLSNIVVHDLLGEDYANQLDLAVHFAVETFFNSSNLIGSSLLADFVAQHSRADWDRLLKEWPCLTGDSAIRLRFAGQEKQTAH